MMQSKKHHKHFRINQRAWRCFLIVLITTLIKGLNANAQAVSVSPSRLFFTGDKGQELTQQITLTNTGKTALTFKSSLMDWGRDSVGEKHYFQPGTQQLSNTAWLEILPNVVEVQAGSQRQVTVIMHVPKDAQPNLITHSMLFLTQINEQMGSKTLSNHPTIGVIIKLEFGIHVYYTPPEASKKDLDFLAFYNDGVKKVGNNQLTRIAVKIKNRGEVVTDGFISFEVTNKTTGDEFKIAPRAISMLPNDEQVVYLDLPDKIKGHYLLVALLDGGEETNLKVAKKELDFGN